MERDELAKNIAAELATVKNRALNMNALNALINAFEGNPLTALVKLFTGRAGAVDAEEHKIERARILDLLCAIDDKITSAPSNPMQNGVVVAGLIEASGVDGDVIGLEIKHDAPPVHFQGDAVIRASSTGSGNVTGLSISGGGMVIDGSKVTVRPDV